MKNTIRPTKNSLIEGKDILSLWRLFIKNIIIILLLPALSYVMGYIYTFRLTDIYGADAQLLLKSNETYDYQDPIYKGLGAYSTYTDIQNQIRILNSRSLIGEVIDKLEIKVSQFVVGRLRRQEVFNTLPFKCTVDVIDQRFYEIPISIAIKNAETYEIKYEFDNKVVEHTGFFGTELSTSQFNIRLEKLYGFDEEGLAVISKSNYEIIVHTRDYLISKYQSNITVENIDFTSILKVSVTDELMNRGVIFLDSLCHTYVDYTRRIQLEVNQNTLDNIQRQIDTVRQFIEEKEASILNYKENNSILDIDREGNQYFDEYFVLNQNIGELEEQKSSVLSLEKYLSSELDEHMLPPYFYVERSDIYLAELIASLRTKQSKLETMRTQVSEDNLGFKNVRVEIQALKSDIKSYLNNLKIALNVKIDELNESASRYKSKITDLPKSAQDILNIQRELDVNNKMYLFLLEKKTNTLITRAGIIPQVRVIEEPRSIGVVRPNKSKIRITSLLVGLLAALVIAVIRSMFFERIENVKELSDATTLSVIGGVPFVKQHQSYQVAVNLSPKSQVTESFRTIRTNLSFLGSESVHCKSILISSFFPGEGKTFTSTNLAALLAGGEKKVLIIDFDLHKPKIHKMFDLDNQIGVSSFLIGRADLNSIVKSSNRDFLDIITAGPIAPNPSELIQKKKVDEIFDWAKANYDYVIIDTPPFGLLNDALELSKFTNVFVVVANTRILRKRGVTTIEDILSKMAIGEKGIILNGVKQRRLNYYYAKYVYKYNYSYGYGYGYGGSYQEKEEFD